jgi:hypothetical protein
MKRDLSLTSLAFMRIWKAPILCLFLQFLCALLSNAMAQSDKIVERYPFEVVMDIVWQGHDIQIRKALSCNMRRRLYPFVWDQDITRVYHVLPSKEVLIVELPHVCEGLNKLPRTSLTPLPGGYLPVVYWINNAEKPTEAEEILSDKYYSENSNRRLVMSSFRVENAGNADVAVSERDQHLSWLIWSPSYRYDSVFVGLRAIAVPRSEWSKYPAVVDALERFTESGPVDYKFLLRVAPALLATCQGGLVGIASSVRCTSSALDTRHYMASVTNEHGIWRLQYGDVGVARLFKFADVKELDAQGCPTFMPDCNLGKVRYQFEIDGKIYERGMRGTAGIFFDVRKQELIRLSFVQANSTLNREVIK